MRVSEGVQERGVDCDREGKGSPPALLAAGVGAGASGLGVLLVPRDNSKTGEVCWGCYGSGSHSEAWAPNPFLGPTRSRLFP